MSGYLRVQVWHHHLNIWDSGIGLRANREGSGSAAHLGRHILEMTGEDPDCSVAAVRAVAVYLRALPIIFVFR